MKVSTKRPSRGPSRAWSSLPERRFPGAGTCDDDLSGSVGADDFLGNPAEFRFEVGHHLQGLS
jgi:hypothetical protein